MNEEMNDGFVGEEEFLSRLVTSRNAKLDAIETEEMRNRRISAAILAKPFCKVLKENFVHAIEESGGELTDGTRTTIDFRVNDLVISTVQAIVEEKSDKEWQDSIEVTMLALGSPEIDFSYLRECIESNCKKEIAELKSSHVNSNSLNPLSIAKKGRRRLYHYNSTDKNEKTIGSFEPLFIPDVEQSILDILRSFNIKKSIDVISQAFEAIMAFYENEKSLPTDIRQIKGKDSFNAEDYVRLGKMCNFLEKERLAVRLYATGYFAFGEPTWRGKALVNLADLYFYKIQFKRNGGKKNDIMKAVDLLTEALTLGCVKEARDTLEGMRQLVFEGYDKKQPNMEFFIQNYAVDDLCLAGYCLAIGMGWKKNVQLATKFFEVVLSHGYKRASYYLCEIHAGRV